MFKEIDTDSDGLISLAEMLNARVLRDSETKELLYPERDIAGGITTVDKDGDGQVSFQEFIAIVGWF